MTTRPVGIKEIDELLSLSGNRVNIERLLSACLSIAIELFGAHDPRVKDVRKFRKLQGLSGQFFACKGFLKDIRSNIESNKFSQESESRKVIMRPVEIFFSYAHEDEDLMDDARRQLILYDRQGIITKWHDRKILPGQEWKGMIDQRLKQARIILLFISPHFIESKYCYNVEMSEALRRHEAHEATVIPIILRPCPWPDAPFGQLQALPEDGRAITQWQDRDQATLNVADGIMRVVREMST